MKQSRQNMRTQREPIEGLGGTIQRMRERRGMGLSELARKADLSKGLLHKVEALSDSNPCLNTLEAIATGLGVPLWRILKESCK